MWSVWRFCPIIPWEFSNGRLWVFPTLWKGSNRPQKSGWKMPSGSSGSENRIKNKEPRCGRISGLLCRGSFCEKMARLVANIWQYRECKDIFYSCIFLLTNPYMRHIMNIWIVVHMRHQPNMRCKAICIVNQRIPSVGRCCVPAAHV